MSNEYKHVWSLVGRDLRGYSHLKAENVCVSGQNFLEKHVLSLGRLQAVAIREKLATLA